MFTSSEQINVFPYYKYTKLGTFSYVMAKQQMVAQRDKAAQDSGESITRQNGDIVLENDQYYYYKVDDDGTNKYLLTLVTGRQPVAYQDIQQIPENLGYDYYYRVNRVYFCCTDGDSTDENNNYKFTGLVLCELSGSVEYLCTGGKFNSNLLCFRCQLYFDTGNRRF